MATAELLKDAILESSRELLRRDPHHPSTALIGHAVRNLLQSKADPQALGAAYEAVLALDLRVVQGELEAKPVRNHARRRAGVYYTPDWLVSLVLDMALDPVMHGRSAQDLLKLRVLDPACGSGAFLGAAAVRLGERLAQARAGATPTRAQTTRAIAEVSQRCIFGLDSDPVAVDLCRATLTALGGSGQESRISVGDGLLDEPPGGEGFDVVIGNPPFLNRLERATAVHTQMASRLRNRFGDAAQAYTDLAALFLLRAVQAARPGGRVAMVLPQSVLGSRDAAGVRREVTRRAAMTDLWLADTQVFDASVFVCVPSFCLGTRQGPIRRRVGSQNAAARVAMPPAESWSPLGAVDVPEVQIQTTHTLAEHADIAADFRDEYYGLRGLVIEQQARSPKFPALITTGLIEPAQCSWGEKACRFAGHTWLSPRVDLKRLSRETQLGPWARSRLRPKLLLATQTQVLEVAPDIRGEWLPVTPLISIIPRRKADLWKLGAVLSSPVLSALAARQSAGTALTRRAIKLSASQVRALPWPSRDLKDAASLFRKASAVAGPAKRSLLVACAKGTCAAYGLTQADSRRLLAWWESRLPPRYTPSRIG